jgi:hypothetical protein
MQPFLVYYWVSLTDKSRPISEYLYADSIEAVEKIVSERLDQKRFTTESESHGRVIVMTAHVEYVEIERIQSAESLTDILGG